VLISWHESAWADYLRWQARDKKTLRRVNALIRDIQRNGYKTTGKPEPLRGDLSGWWSVRINSEHRCRRRLKTRPKRRSKSRPPDQDWTGDCSGGLGSD